MQSETVLDLAGEGGGYCITRIFVDGGWRFGVSSQDVFEDSEPAGIATFPTLEEALENINSGWPRLRALFVHPAFASELYELALTRLAPSATALAQWVAARGNGSVGSEEFR